MNFIRTLPALLSALLAACLPMADHYDLSAIRPGSSRAEEIRQRYGPPGAQFPGANGGQVWEYSRQPEGRHCYMVSFDAQGVVLEVRQVLVADGYRSIHAGMSREAVRRQLGKPASVVTFANVSEEVWEWHVEGDTPLEDTYFSVHFDLSSGTVTRTGRRVKQTA